MKRILMLAVACVALACWTGGAVAGNGNGGTPPGQEKKADATTSPPAAQPATQPAAQPSQGNPSPPGQAKQQAKANSSTPGVKPSSTTSKRTTCYTGGTTASPTCTPGTKADSSKQYGNGKTAAQIATSRGAPAGTAIYGPGNSQPHKVISCKHPLHGKGGGVDVHAVKSYSNADCSTQQQQSEHQSTKVETNCAGTTAVTTSTSTHTVYANKHGMAKLHGNAGSHGKHKGLKSSQATSSSTTSTFTPSGANCGMSENANTAQMNNAVTLAATPAATPATSPATAAAQPNGVLGAQATITHPVKRTGVLGAVSRLGRLGTTATLPFTGFPLWIAAFAALILIAGGLVARGGWRGRTQR